MLMPSENVKAWRKRTKERLVKAFGSSCGICGYNKCVKALDFHHLDPDQKDFSFGKVRANIKSWDKIVVEARKCVMLCANCHREVHADIIDIPEDIRRFDENFATYKALPRGANLRPKEVVLSPCLVCGTMCERKYCSTICASKARQKVDWDNVDLVALKKTMNNVQIAKQLGVSETMIRKRLKKI